MALSEFEQKRYERTMSDFIEKHRPPPHIRAQLDLGYRVSGQSVEIFEIRPRWDNPGEKIEGSVAKATFTKNQGIWKIYWQRADLKWHRYEPFPEAVSLEEFLMVVEKDAYACFFG
jgi:hypothetical protein